MNRGIASPSSRREQRRREMQEAVHEFGGPIFVPAGVGVWSPVWRFGGRGRSGGVASSIEVSAYDHASREHVFVSTSLKSEYQQGSGLVGGLLAEGVPSDVELPYTITVFEHPVSMRLDADETLDLRVLVVERNWVAFGPADDRQIKIRGRGLSPEELVLERITAVSNIANSRWE